MGGLGSGTEETGRDAALDRSPCIPALTSTRTGSITSTEMLRNTTISTALLAGCLLCPQPVHAQYSQELSLDRLQRATWPMDASGGQYGPLTAPLPRTVRESVTVRQQRLPHLRLPPLFQRVRGRIREIRLRSVQSFDDGTQLVQVELIEDSQDTPYEGDECSLGGGAAVQLQSPPVCINGRCYQQ